VPHRVHVARVRYDAAMGIPIGLETSSSTKGTRKFRCKRCGHRQSAEVHGIGEGVQSFLNSPGTAQRRARADALKDLDRTIKLARCPSCEQRNPGALRGFWMFFVYIFAFMLGLGIVLGFWPTWTGMNMGERDKAICRWLVPLILGGTAALIIPFHAMRRWGSLDRRVRWLPPSEQDEELAERFRNVT